MNKFFKDIKWFFLCMLKDKCIYSIKKFLSYIFSILAIYLAIFTDKDAMFLETVGFVAALLAIRAYDKKGRQNSDDVDYNRDNDYYNRDYESNYNNNQNQDNYNNYNNKRNNDDIG